MPKFVLFFDRREWSAGKAVVEAETEDEAWELYRTGVLDDRLEQIAWDIPDDTEIALVNVEALSAPN